MYKVMKTFICRSCMNPVTGTGRTSVDIGVNANLELVDKLGLELGLGYGFVLGLVYGHGIWFVLLLALAFYENIRNTSHFITMYHYWTRY